MKKLLALLLCLAMVFSLVACGSGNDEVSEATASAASAAAPAAAEAEKTEPIKIGFATKTLTGSYFVKLVENVEAACKELGWECITLNADRDVQTEAANVESLVAQGCDLIFLNCVDPEAAVSVVQGALDAGVPTIAVDGGCSEDTPLITTVYSNNQQNGRMVGLAYAAKMNGEPVKAIMVSGSKGDVAGYERRRGLFCGIIEGMTGMTEEEAWAAADDIENQLVNTGKAENADAKFTIVGQGWSGWSEDGGLTASEDLIAANPDINCILGENDDMVFGAGLAVENAGLEGVDLVAAADGAQRAYDLIKEGKYFATGENSPALVGRLAMEIAKQYLLEGKTEFDKVTYTDAVAVTKENVDERYDYGF